MTRKNPHIGSRLEELLAKEGLLAESSAMALKRVLAWQLEQAMQEHHITKTVMARRMKTSRASLNRLLDPNNPSVTLRTIERAAAVLGKIVRLEIVDAAQSEEA